MKKFLTFGGPHPRFYNNVFRICMEAYNLEYFDMIMGFTEHNLIQDIHFWNKHEQFILNNTRGVGYWIWKPYLINRELEKMNDGDILIYADSGCKINASGKSRLFEYIDILNNDPKKYGIISFSLSLPEYKYTKKAVFNYFNFGEEIKFNNQCMATVIIIKKTKHSSQLIRLWSNITQNYYLINDDIDVNNEDSQFIKHRHDQSIYSVLVNRFGSIKLKDETYFENWEESNKYPFLALRL